MTTKTNEKTALLKERLLKRPALLLDSIYELLPDGRMHAELILHLIQELIQERRLNRIQVYKRMEEPLYFQESHFHDFTKRDPLIGRIARAGGLKLFNYYLQFKFGTPLSKDLLQRCNIFLFKLPPLITYYDKDKWVVHTNSRERVAIIKKYYSSYGQTYEMLGDILQAPDGEILKRLIDCGFDFNNSETLHHLKQYFFVNRDRAFHLNDIRLMILLNNGLMPNRYIHLLLESLFDEFSITLLPKITNSILRVTSFMLDHGATLDSFQKVFIHDLMQLFRQHETHSTPVEREALFYLMGQVIELTRDFHAAKKYYLKAGENGRLKLMKEPKQLMLYIPKQNNRF